MDTTAGHDALLDEIAEAKAKVDAAFRAMWSAGGTDEHAARIADWRAAHAAHSALIRAGVVMTLGPLKEDDPQ